MARRARRIVSFLASATEILVELGLEDHIVGISHECDYPAHVLNRPRLSKPRFDPSSLNSGEIDQAVRDAMQQHGSVYEIDRAMLAELQPDLIFTQAVCEVCAVPTPGVRRVATELDLDAIVVSLDAHTVSDILASIVQVAAAAGVPQRGELVSSLLRRRIDAVETAVAKAPRPRVVALEWLDPPFTPGHWVPEMIQIAGGDNLAGTKGSHSDQVEWDDLNSLDPDVLLVMPCGYDVRKSTEDADANEAHLESVAPRAIVEDRAWVVNGSSYFNRSGPRFVDGIEILAGILHPDRWQRPDAADATQWSPSHSSQGIQHEH